jgi:hypothetical protein
MKIFIKYLFDLLTEHEFLGFAQIILVVPFLQWIYSYC